MAKKNVKPSDLAAAVLKEMENYTEEVTAAIETATKKILKESRADVSAKSPKRTGAYSKDWAVQYIKGKNFIEGRVYNRDHYQLTHLLENGHVIKNGTGRTFGRVAAREHIGPVNDRAQQELEEAIKEAIGNG